MYEYIIFFISSFGHTNIISLLSEKKSPLKYILPSVEHKNINNQINV